MKTMEWIWLVLTLIYVVAIASVIASPYRNRFPNDLTQQQPTNRQLLKDYFESQRSSVEDVWPDESDEILIPEVEKRGGCAGFPCMLTHIGNSAGSSSIKALKMSILRECLSDPLCFGQRRKKRGFSDWLETMKTKRWSMEDAERSGTRAQIGYGDFYH